MGGGGGRGNGLVSPLTKIQSFPATRLITDNGTQSGFFFLVVVVTMCFFIVDVFLVVQVPQWWEGGNSDLLGQVVLL